MKRPRIHPPCPANNIVDLSTALPLVEESAVWKKRAQDVRANEWALYQKSLEVVDQALDRILARRFDPVTLDELAKLIEVAFSLGRRAAGLPVDGSQQSSVPDSHSAFMREVDQALDRVYGQSGRDGSPSRPVSNAVATDKSPSCPPDAVEPVAPKSNEIGSPLNQPGARTEVPATKVAITEIGPTQVPQTDSAPTQVAPPEGGHSTSPEGAEGQRPTKHKPYWLNGHYYANPEYPEAVARAMWSTRYR